MALSQEEKDDLLEIIELIYGYNSDMQTYKSGFNEQTVEAVENALAALITCNENMKTLVVELLGGAKFFAKGWLRKVIGQTRRILKNDKIKFNGIACRNVTAAKWKSAIIISTY